VAVSGRIPPFVKPLGPVVVPAKSSL